MNQSSIEQWLPVVGYKGLYEVSDHGNVRSIDRIISYPSGRIMRWKGKLLTPGKTGDRVTVALGGPKGARSHYVHNLVLTAFVQPCPDNMECCHGDNNGTNNNLANLRWDTRSENMYDRVKHGVHPARNRTHCPFEHELKQPNLIAHTAANGFRNCLACNRAQSYLQKRPMLDFKITADTYYKKIMS
jgi:hypothetical protein